MLSRYKQKANANKKKIIKRDVKRFKKICLREFHNGINRGLDVTTVDFLTEVTPDFQEEISEIVLMELKQEHNDIEFSFSFRHFEDSYKGIMMKAI